MVVSLVLVVRGGGGGGWGEFIHLSRMLTVKSLSGILSMLFLTVHAVEDSS